MTTERYTILRRRRPDRGGLQTKALGGDGRRELPVQVTVQDLDEKEAQQAKDDPEVQIARHFQTKLIQPLGAKAADAVPDWGVEAVGATSSSMTGEGVVVAVLDTGIDKGHEAFATVDVIEEDLSGAGNGDRNGHGSHCAGIIFGGDVGGRRIGVAPGVRRALIGKVLDDSGGGDTPMLFRGMQWALAQGAHIISISIGFDFPGQVRNLIDLGWRPDIAASEALDGFRENLDMLNALMAEIKANRPFGTQPLVVAAAGNESLRQSNPDWRVSASLPAAAAHVAVAAIGQRGADYEVAPFSNTKPTLAAPGVDIVSAKAGGGLLAESGTSMACPHVAGVAALWADKLRRGGDPSDAETLLSYLIANTTRDRLVGCDILDTGRGLVQAPR